MAAAALLELVEEEHGDLGHVLHDEKVQKDLEKCFEAPNPILPETNEIIWGALSFFLLFFFMVKKGFPAVKGAMDARADNGPAGGDGFYAHRPDSGFTQSAIQFRLG